MISGDFVVSPTFHADSALKRFVMNGWQWSGKVYWHTGMPYSIIDGNDDGGIGNGGGTILATINPGAPVQTSSCGKSALNNQLPGATFTPCLNAGAFYDTYNNVISAFPNQTRNQFRGAGYFDIDMGLFKNIQIKERMNLAIGLMAYNALNHPNMPFPNNTFFDRRPHLRYDYCWTRCRRPNQPLWQLPGLRLFTANRSALGEDHFLTPKSISTKREPGNRLPFFIGSIMLRTSCSFSFVVVAVHNL